MYASTWTFDGDPDALAAAYEAFLAEVPAAQMRLHACVRTADGLLVLDTCPSRAAFEQFVAAPWLADAMARHGLPRPRVEGRELVAAFADGRRVDRGA